MPRTVSAVRTAIGAARKGTLSETEPSVLALAVIEESLARTGLAPTEIDDLISVAPCRAKWTPSHVARLATPGAGEDGVG